MCVCNTEMGISKFLVTCVFTIIYIMMTFHIDNKIFSSFFNIFHYIHNIIFNYKRYLSVRRYNGREKTLAKNHKASFAEVEILSKTILGCCCHRH